MGLPLLKETVKLSKTDKDGLSGIEDFSTEQPRFGSMYQERVDKELPRLCEPSEGKHVNVMKSRGRSQSLQIRGKASARFPGWLSGVSHSGHEGKERQRQMFVRHRDIGRTVWWLSFSWLCGWRKGYAEEGHLTQPRLRGGQEAPAQDSHTVHLPLLAAVYSLLRLSGSAGIKLGCRGVTQCLPEPHAAAGAGHSFWGATRIPSLDTAALEEQAPPLSLANPRRLGRSQAVKGQFPLFPYHSPVLPADNDVNLQGGLCCI